MNPQNPLAVLSGDRQLQIGFALEDIVKLSVGLFCAVLLALIVAKHL